MSVAKNAMKCDICGKLYELYDNEQFDGFATTYRSTVSYGDFVDVFHYDLCPECRKTLSSWLNSFNTLDNKEAETK